jgi:hypothetical protein
MELGKIARERRIPKNIARPKANILARPEQQRHLETTALYLFLLLFDYVSCGFAGFRAGLRCSAIRFRLQYGAKYRNAA